MNIGEFVKDGESEMAIATLGVIVGNRDFFPDHLVTEARRDVFRGLDVGVVMLGEHESKLGGVETYADAQTTQAPATSISAHPSAVSLAH